MMNIVIPMAGLGSRFAEKGYTFPKPLIEVKGRPMIELVIKNLTPASEHRFTFLCRKEHLEKYNIHGLLKLLAPTCNVITLEGVTAGAACTVLLAKEAINNDDELLIANSDQFIETDINDFLSAARQPGLDGSIMTFKATHPKWSFAKVGADGLVSEVAEKNPISDNATVGVYHVKHGADFVSGAENMIRKNIRTNNEFYVCPVFNEMILADKQVKIFEIPAAQMHGIGTPEDLDLFLQSDAYKRL